MDFSGITDAIIQLWNSVIEAIGGLGPWLESTFAVADWLGAITDWISAFPFF